MADDGTGGTGASEEAEGTEPEGAEGNERSGTDLEEWRKHARNWERRAKATERELATLRTQQMSDQERAVSEAKKAGASEVLAMANERLLRAEVRVAAAGKFADPEDATRFLDLKQFAVDDDGEVDTKAIATAVAKLLESRPYLGVNAPRQTGHGSADQGLNGGGPAPRTDDMNALIRRAAGRM